jgi:hypothetical protein
MNKLMVMLAVTFLTTGLVAALLWQQTQDERDANAALQARVSALEAALPTASAPLAPAPATAAVTAETPATPTPGEAFPAEQAEAMAANLSQMMTTPEGREMMRAQARMNMSRLFPHLGAELGMSPAELDKFYDLLAKQQADMMVDSMMASADPGRDSGATQEFRQPSRQMERQRANGAEIEAALGTKFPQWLSYQQTLPLRQQVAQLQSQLGDGDALSDAQARSLVTTLAAEKARIDQEQQRSGPPLPPSGTREQYREQFQAQQQQRRADSNRRLLEVAAAHLTPQQVASYRRLLDQEQEMERMLMRSMEAQRPVQGQGGPAAIPSPR